MASAKHSLCLVLALAAVAACSSCAREDRRVPTAPPPPAPVVEPPAVVEAPGAPGTPAATPAVSSALTAETVAPYFRDGPAADAMRRFALEDWQAARAGFRAHVTERGARLSAEDRARLALLIAICDARLDEWAAAVPGFDAAAAALPLVADFAHYEAAVASYFARDLAAAERHARQVRPDSRHHADALLLIGDILRALARWKEVAAHYAAYRQGRRRGPRLAEAMFRQAEALEKTGNAVPEAIAVYRSITISHPVDEPWSADANARFKALLKTVPRRKRPPLERFTAAEHLQRGMALYRAHRNPEAAAELGRVAKAGGTPAQLCTARYHQADSWWKERSRTRSAPLFDEAIELCKKAGNVDLEVKAAYQAGRSYDRLDDKDAAVARFNLITAHDHSYADDAVLRAAEQFREHGDDATYVTMLEQIPQQYPDGDMKPVVLWRLAWAAFKDKRYADTIGWLDQAIALNPIELHWRRAGQAQYWKGRALAELGRSADAVAAYRETIRLYPLTYYSLLALNRLRDDHPAIFAEVQREITATPPGFDPAQPALVFKDRPLYRGERFERALAYLRLGLTEEAAFELSRAGLAAPGHRRPVADDDQRDLLWAMAFLYDAAGRYDKSHWPTRYNLTEYQRHWPTGRWRTHWRIAYPLAFTDLVAKNARKHGYPDELQLGIMREESAFNPLLESWANAVGLTQMISSTAKRFAKGTGIAVTRENLRDPDKNLTIGSNFLGFLWNTFQGRVGFAVPSYNAGEGASWRWMIERHSPDWTYDMWQEEIPGDQARGYTKRVIGAYFAYAFLKDATIPAMPQGVPLDLVPEWRRKRK